MRRIGPFAFVLLLLLPIVRVACAEEPKVKPIPPKLAAENEVREALAAFKKAFAAKGLKGDDKIGERVFALRDLGKVKHPLVVDALAKAAKHREAEVRLTGLMQLKLQKALPGYAGKKVVALLARYRKDETYVLAGLEVIRELGYLGARDLVTKLIHDGRFPVAKYALVTIGELRDARYVDDIMKLIGLRSIEKGSTTEGTETRVDTGAAGDADQRAAAGGANNPGGAGPPGGAMGGVGGKKGASVGRDLGPAVFMALRKLTGVKFKNALEATTWIAANRKKLDEACKSAAKSDDAQQVAAKALKSK